MITKGIFDLPFIASSQSSSLCVFATDWAARVVVNGGAAPSHATQVAICRFQNGLVTDGIDSKVLAYNAVVPDNAIAARTPQLVGPGSSLWINAGTPGALTVNGQAGDLVGGPNFHWQTGISPAAVYSGIANAGFCLYCFSAAANGFSAGIVSGSVMEIAAKYSDNSSYFRNATVGSSISVPALGGGWFSTQRVSVTNHKAFFANSTNPHAQVGATQTSDVTGTTPGVDEFYIFGVDLTGSVAAACDDVISFVGWTAGLTSAEDALLAARVQQLRVDLGGGFV